LDTTSAGERSNQTRIARRRAEEEGGDMSFVPDRRRSKRLQSAIRARDVRAADLQEEPTKPVENRAVLRGWSFRRIRRRRRLPGEHLSERSEPLDTASASERSNQTRRRPSTRASSSSMTSAATCSSSRSGRDTSRPRMARSRVTSPETPSRPKSRGKRSRESCVVPE
jgi:hypothetical protein